MEVLEAVLDESTDPIFNILADGTYRYVNRAFSQPFGREPGDIIGKRIWDLFDRGEAEKRMAVVCRAFDTAETIVFEVRVPVSSGDRFYVTSVKPILDADGAVASVICISKDITQRKQMELEREELIRSLQAALAEVQTLSGLLPICGHCKKIRDERDAWVHIEHYLQERTDASFTHSVCPDCRSAHFPELG